MLPCPYFHVTVTVPEELRDALRANQRDGYALLMKAAADAIVELARDRRYVGAPDVGVDAIGHEDGTTAPEETTAALFLFRTREQISRGRG